MASLLDMRRRIKSVKNTQQITKAMKMVAAAKLKRAQDRVTAARPFAQKMSEVLTGLSARVADEVSHPLLDDRGDEKYMIVLVSADKGLAGGFNANIIKAARITLAQLRWIPASSSSREKGMRSSTQSSIAIAAKLVNPPGLSAAILAKNSPSWLNDLIQSSPLSRRYTFLINPEPTT